MNGKEKDRALPYVLFSPLPYPILPYPILSLRGKQPLAVGWSGERAEVP